jgi:thymidylate synthase
VIGRIKEMPKCRRLIVSAWNPAELEEMALPPCHAMMQFHVMNGKLSCHLYQRSADAFLGVPFNIASYALLTHMIAQVTGLEVGEFVHTFGDLHIYEGHLSVVQEQLARAPLPLPQLWLDPTIKNINDFKPEHMKLLNYSSHSTLKADVAI